MPIEPPARPCEHARRAVSPIASACAGRARARARPAPARMSLERAPRRASRSAFIARHASPCASSQRMPSRGAQSHDGQHGCRVHELVGLLRDLERVEQVEVDGDRRAGLPQARRRTPRGTARGRARSRRRCRARGARAPALPRARVGPPAASRTAPRGRASAAATRRRAAASPGAGAPRSAAAARPRSRSPGSRRRATRIWPRWRSAWMRITIGVVATASKRETRAAIAGASSRSSSAASRSTAATAGRARLSCRCASIRQARSSSRVASRGARSGASGGGVASAAWSPAMSVPRSAATSVAHSRLADAGRRDELREELRGLLVRVRGRRRRTPGASRPSRRPRRGSRPPPSPRAAARPGTPPPRTGRRSARGRG